MSQSDGQKMLYIDSRVLTGIELSELSGPWMDSSGDELCREGVTHAKLADAPAGAALDTAQRIQETIDGVFLPASESDTEGRAFVIANVEPSTSNDEKKTLCLQALGVKPEAWSEATFKERDWSTHGKGFCYSPGDVDDDEDEEDDDQAKIRAATKIMTDKLESGFEFNFSEELSCAPVLYGGFVDGSMVGVLSMRVWT